MLLELEETENINDVFTNDTIVYEKCKQCRSNAIVYKENSNDLNATRIHSSFPYQGLQPPVLFFKLT